MSGMHKDFHGYHNFILDYVEKRFGREFLENGMHRIGRNVYAPVAQRLAKEGLPFLARYWGELFAMEEGRCEVELHKGRLTLKVLQCPAISHIADRGWLPAPSFCDHCRIVNEEICHIAGYRCSLEFDQEKGRCVQVYCLGGGRQ